jgi:hypothetical protein
MRAISIALVSGLILAGCASPRDTSKAAAQKAGRKPVPKVTLAPSPAKSGAPANPPVSSLTVTNKNQVITLSDQTVGKVYSVNQVARFVILDYGLNPLPPLEQRLNVYRNGVRVGELKVTGPVMNGNIAADIMAGEVRRDDQVRRD